jgi:regulator of RNase E activity RraB
MAKFAVLKEGEVAITKSLMAAFRRDMVKLEYLMEFNVDGWDVYDEAMEAMKDETGQED